MKVKRGSTTDYILSFVLLLLFAAFMYWAFTYENPNPSVVKQSVIDAYSAICTSLSTPEGERVDEATLFSGATSGPVRTLLLNASGSAYESRKGLGKGWNPSSVSEVQLVVCVGKEVDTAGACGGVRYLNLNARHVTVVEAKTGAQVYGFTLWGRYWCEGESHYEDEYSISSIRAKLEEALSSGKIAAPNQRYFRRADILQDPEGRYTHIRIIAHRFRDGERVMFDLVRDARADPKATVGLAQGQQYCVHSVDEDILQLLSRENGDPIEVRAVDFGNSIGVLRKEPE